MKKHIKYWCITVIAIVLADIGVGKLLDYLSAKQKSNYIFEMRYKLNQANPDIYIIGSSRVAHHYNSAIIQQSCGLRTMNYGIDGTDIFMDYVLISHLAKRSKGTETIVVDINIHELESKELAYSYITRLYPLVNEVDEIKENANRYSRYERMKLLSNTYRYNDYLVALLQGFNGKKDTAAVTGFRPINRTLIKTEKVVIKKDELNPEAMDYLNKIAALCKQKKVKLVIAVSPAYVSNIKSASTYSALLAFTQQHNIPFMYYGDFDKTQDVSNYSDYSHLNAKGAAIFSSQFAMDLAKILKR